MSDFAINPPIHVTGRHGTFIRSTKEAAAFVREHILQHYDGQSADVLRRLEAVSSRDEAHSAAVEFRSWIASRTHAPSSVAVKNSAPLGHEP
jgi:hypothetical protein